jgi:hypothetical protein
MNLNKYEEEEYVTRRKRQRKKRRTWRDETIAIIDELKAWNGRMLLTLSQRSS